MIAPQLVGLLQRVRLAAEQDPKYEEQRQLLRSQGDSPDRPPLPDGKSVDSVGEYTLFENVIFKGQAKWSCRKKNHSGPWRSRRPMMGK